MSDYGDDYSDDGDGEEWFYVEEEYIRADDLAEHAVPSPPPTVYDEDLLEDWDRFDYFNDLEYASDGYDNASFEPNNGTGAAKIGHKRKRGATATRGRKKQRLTTRTMGHDDSSMLPNSPVVWRPQANRGLKPRVLAENAESYALLKDWREKLTDTPEWAQQSSHPASPEDTSAEGSKAQRALVSEPLSLTLGADPGEEEENTDIDPTALMAVLQDRLAAAGGPLAGMDPQQLLSFAMRMATDKDAGDDIAGELADEMLGQGDEDEDEEDEDAGEKLLSWVAQQRDATEHALPNGDFPAVRPKPKSPDASHGATRPPTPPSSEATRSVRVADEVMKDVEPNIENASTFTKNNTLEVEQVSRKRKATDTADAENSTVATKRRATRSYDAPTASSQAKTTAPRTMRSGRVKR
ncbi:hypothetical protein K458DRAFT_420463 [Lentithecium fluviatile CBS 122367]|uniref:Uncharacterized protein n=1 Tax=Lentithecium fluviatile CBS 122367 TaxID=1168545 RepID=A0A6G1ITY5_9PLEO|nr:hypothetical protein K458DRAFT_420463 [Lentithecium fluviatile CBS 122367]